MYINNGSPSNFTHRFKYINGEYKWSDWDKPPLRYWVEKMVTLFGYSDKGKQSWDPIK